MSQSPENINKYTLSVYSESSLGLLNRVSGIFLRRHVNIESINASRSEIRDVYKYTIVVKTTEAQVKKICGQLERQVEVIKAYFHTDDEIIYQESVIFKLPTEKLYEDELQAIITRFNGSILSITPLFFVVIKSGKREEIIELYQQLEPFGILQSVRSGRIAISKTEMPIRDFINTIN